MKRVHFTFFVLVIGLFFHFHSLRAQTTPPAPYNPDKKIGKAQLQKDFLALRNSLEEAQASLYRYHTKKTMDANFETHFAAIDRDMTEREFYQTVTSMLSEIGDGHSNAFITRDFRNYLNQSAKMFPLRLRFIDRKAYVLSSPLSAVVPGLEIRSINGHPMSSVIRDLFGHLTGDGRIETGKFWKLNEQFSLYYYLFVEQPEKFRIECYDQSKMVRKRIEVPALTRSEQQNALTGNTASPAVDDKKPLRFESLAVPNAVLLTIETFDDGAIEKAGQNFPKFLESTFHRIIEQNIQDLVIDLRGNDGGADFGPLLFSYLTDKPFRFVDYIEAATNKPSIILNYTQVGRDFLKRLDESLTPSGGGRYRVKTETESTLSTQNPRSENYHNRVWFITNGETFSSTAMFCDLARSQHRGAFVGEETGGDYYGNSAGEFVVITLPETKIKVIVALEEYVMAVNPGPERGRGVIPDYLVQPTINEIIKARDAELNQTVELIEQARARRV